MVKIGRGGETAGGRVLGVAFIFLGFKYGRDLHEGSLKTHQ